MWRKSYSQRLNPSQLPGFVQNLREAFNAAQGLNALTKQIQEIQLVQQQMQQQIQGIQQALDALPVERERAIAWAFNLTVSLYDNTLRPLPLNDGHNPAGLPQTLPEFFTMTRMDH
ncbi:hypothetical protein RhiLY_10852 [Ceratobasidium sp. AG-Ba]|nr:hypothetical protein RhiLY_10852 [Ceratobasidium sp. AG-Ba]